MKLSKAERVSLTSKYLRVVRGRGLESGESPIKIASGYLEQKHLRKKTESIPEFLDRLADEMRSVVASSPSKETRNKKSKKNAKKASAEFLETFAWRKLRMQALLKYGPKCMCCGATPQTGAIMNVDHIKPRKTHPELAMSLDNLQILCHECNHGKGNWDSTDWRPERPEESQCMKAGDIYTGNCSKH